MMVTSKMNGAPTVAMRRVALFIDGFSRATLLPFAPVLLDGVLNKRESDNIETSPLAGNTSGVIWCTAVLVAIYIIGHGVGVGIGKHVGFVKRSFPDGNGRNFSRTVAIVIALHLFSFGSRYEVPVGLYLIRFVMGVLVGLVKQMSYPRLCIEHDYDDIDESTYHRSAASLMTAKHGTAKVWLTGFSVSILTGGLIFNPLRSSSVFSILTGGKHPWSFVISPLFFIAIVHVTTLLLKHCCLKFLNEEFETNPIYRQVSLSESNDGNIILNMPQSIKKRRESCSGSRVEEGNSHWKHPNRVRLGSYNRAQIGSYNRTRQDSSVSNRSDIFFDCDSQLSPNGNNTFDEFEDVSFKEDTPKLLSISTEHNNSVAKMLDNRCVYEDGTPSPVPSGLCCAIVPDSYEVIHTSKSSEKWQESQKWRIERHVWRILDSPHPWYPKIKDAYSHLLHGYTKDGYPVVYETLGTMTLKNLFQNGLTVEDMLHHYTYFMEFISNVLCNKAEVREVLDKRSADKAASRWGFVVVMDISGLSLTILSNEVAQYLKNAGDINTSHYPKSTERALLVNSPSWISGFYGTLKRFLPESVTTELLTSANQNEGLRKWIDEDQIPAEFGGSSPYKLGEHPFEVEINALVEKGLNKPDIDSERDIENYQSRNDQKKFQSSSKDNGTRQSESDLQYETKPCHQDIELGSNLGTFDNTSSTPPINHTPPKTENRVRTVSLQYIDNGAQQRRTQYHSEEYVFVLTSVMHCLWCSVIGSLETAVPLWLLFAQKVGGAGYGPPKTGASLFVASIVLLWLLRTNISRVAFHIPEKSSLRGYRIGVGAQACLMILLPSVKFLSNDDSMLVMTTTILLGASFTIASMIGRNSSTALHHIASGSYMEKLSLRCDSRTFLGHSINEVVRFAETGGLTYILGSVGEIMGCIFVAPIFAWSTNHDHSFPFDAALSFYTGSCLCGLLYTLSLSLHVKVQGETDVGACRGSRLSLAGVFKLMGNILAVSLSDMASLFEESNWTSSSALGRQNTGVHFGGDAYDYDSKMI